MRKIILSLIFLIFTSLTVYPQSDTVRIMTYNILNFPGNNYNVRMPYFKTVVNNLNPDLLAVQEMQSQVGTNYFLTDVLEQDYDAVPFHDGPDTDNAIFYRSSIVSLLYANYISTDLRDIAEYVFQQNSSQETLRLYSVHLKASQGSTNEQKRLAEVTILKNHLNSLPPESNVIVLGDFNIYTSSEPAFQHLTTDSTVFDPINRLGNWHNNSQFADIHTQSPRTDAFGGGSTGGMDDRFDMILISRSLNDNYNSSSYVAYGNDGFHFNSSINDGNNYAVNDSIADALYYASDHLPVYFDLTFTTPTKLSSDNLQAPQTVTLYPNFPNPFNPATTILYYLPNKSETEIVIMNSLGERVDEIFSGAQSGGDHRITWKPQADVSSGVYFIRLKTGNRTQIRKTIFLR